MKKITFLTLHLGYGGIESSVSALANKLVKDYNVEILSLYKINDKPAFHLDSKIKVKYLIKGFKPTRKEWFDSFKKFKVLKFIKESFNNAYVLFFLRRSKMMRAIKKSKSDIIISTTPSINKKLGNKGNKKIIKIGWEHTHYDNNQNKTKYYSKKVVNSTKKLDYLVVPSMDMFKFYQDKIGDKCIYIPHYIDNDQKKRVKKINYNLVTVGRLSKEKGYLDLLEVFYLLYKKNDKYKLNIIGDGPEKALIENKIKELNLEKNVTMHGFQNHDYINNIMKESSLFVMSSLTESFGLVLLEAFKNTIPAIAFDSAKGATEIIVDNKNGYLIKNRDFKAMANKIDKMLNDEKKYQELADNAYEMIDEYSWNNIQEKWSIILNKDYRSKLKMLLISSTGGHLNELLQLEPLFKKYNYYLITEKTSNNMTLRENHLKVDYLIYGTKSKILLYPFKLIANCFKSLYFYLKFKPDVIITTGAHTAGPMCCIGKIFGSKIIYIETLANLSTKTATGRLVYLFADLFIVQWESMLKIYPKAKYGGWIY